MHFFSCISLSPSILRTINQIFPDRAKKRYLRFGFFPTSMVRTCEGLFKENFSAVPWRRVEFRWSTVTLYTSQTPVLYFSCFRNLPLIISKLQLGHHKCSRNQDIVLPRGPIKNRSVSCTALSTLPYLESNSFIWQTATDNSNTLINWPWHGCGYQPETIQYSVQSSITYISRNRTLLKP